MKIASISAANEYHDMLASETWLPGKSVADKMEAIRSLKKAPLDIGKGLVMHRSGMWIKAGLNGRYDSDVIFEVMFDNVYDLSIFNGNVDLVVDVGAHIGCFAAVARSKYPQAEIVCIEPVPENIACLKRNVDERTTVLEGVISYDSSPMLRYYMPPECAATGGSYLVPSDFPNAMPVSPFNLAGIAHGRRIGLLKLDCEGCEIPVLRSSEMSYVDRVVGEFHDQSQWDGVESHLRSSGFVVQYRLNGSLGIFKAWRHDLSVC